MDNAHSGKARAEEILIFDSSTFVREIGLMSHGGSALKQRFRAVDGPSAAFQHRVGPLGCLAVL